jgi:predicted small lipoprotein YifL
MNKRLMNSLTLAALVALTLSGCGNRLPANPPIDPAAEDTKPAAEEPAVETPVATTPTVPTTPAYQQPLTGSLVVSGIDKKKVGGFIGIGKKLEVKGQVLNTSNVPLTGIVKVKFTKKTGIINKKMEEIGTKDQAIAQLAPGQSISFTLTSDKACDDAEVTVETSQNAVPVAGAAATNPYGQPAVAQTGAYGAYGY